MKEPPDVAAGAEPAPQQPQEVVPEKDAGDDERQKLQQERDQLHDRWMRTAADLENLRKRAAKDLGEQRTLATAEAVRAFLPVLDGFERALDHAQDRAAAAGDSLRQGVELLQRQMQDALRRLGVEPVETAKARFDPHLHEAVEMVETDEAPDHSVVAEVQRGYKLRDRLIRPAMVKVARKP